MLIVMRPQATVGIGTTSPATKLDVQGGAIIASDIVGGAGTTEAFMEGADGVSYFGSVSTQRVAIGNSEDYETLTIDGGNVGIGTQTPQQRLTLGSGLNLGTEMATPSGTPTGTPTTGGALANGNYYYKITALDPAGGETPAGPESAAVNLSGSNNAIQVNWSAVVGASKYRVYRGTSPGGENVYNEALTNSYKDIGGGTSATPPSLNTALAAKLAASGTSWFPYQLCAPPGGGFGLLDPGQSGPSTVMYQGGSDITILRTYSVGQTPAPDATLLNIWAPPESETFPTANREATLTLQRATNNEADSEYLDIYNNYYPPPATNPSTQYGIRIQKRGSGVYRDFVFDKSPQLGTNFPIMMLKASREPCSVGIGVEDRLSKLTVKGPASFSAAGTVAISNGSQSVAGTSTLFTQEVGIGDRVTIFGQTRTVTAIGSDTGLTVDVAFTANQSGQTMTVMTSLFRADDSSGNVHLIVSDQGKVGLGTKTPGNILTVVQGSGTDPIADSWTTYSSRRWKTNISPLVGALEKVERLRGVSYERKEDGKHQIGLVGEEVGEVVPELVVYEENRQDAKSVDYARLTALLIEAIKEQQEQLRELRRKVEARSTGNKQGEVSAKT